MSETITQIKLQSYYEYDKDSGIFTHTKGRGGRHKGDVAGHKIDGYIYLRIKGATYPAHRLAWLYVHGVLPNDELDHINRVRDDNRIDNLREVDREENSKNKSKRSDNTSGVMGVGWHKNRKRWTARISVDKKSINLGTFIEYHEAVNARKNAEILYGYHKNHGKDL